MQKNSYKTLIGSLYFNYIFQGMAAIILSQNMNQLEIHWGATARQITLVMSAIGLGRLLMLSFSGYFSDKFGRKKTSILAMLSHVIFFVGLLLSPNYLVAFFFGLFGGFNNAFLDTSTYPTFVEAYPDKKVNSALSVLNKGFISFGQFVLPFLTRFLIQKELFFGWTFILCAVCLLANIVHIIFATFPEISTGKGAVKSDENEVMPQKLKSRGNFKIDGLVLLVFSFASVSIFNIFIIWIPKFAEQMKIVSYEGSLTLVSVYSVGSFVSVFLTSTIVKKGVNVPKLIIFYLIVAGSALLLMLLHPRFVTVVIAAVCIGIFAAGGIFQLGLALLLELFPAYKGKYTSYYSLAAAVSIMVTPYITGILSEISVSAIFWFNFLLILLGLTAACITNARYAALSRREKGLPPNSGGSGKDYESI